MNDLPPDEQTWDEGLTIGQRLLLRTAVHQTEAAKGMADDLVIG